MPDNLIKLEKVTASYPQIFDAKPFGGRGGTGEPKFGITLIMNKKRDAAQIAMLKQKIAEFKTENKAKTDVTCVHDGSEKASTPGYGPDVVFVRCSSAADRKPFAVDRNRNKHLTAADDKIYGGAVINAWISLWYQDNQYGKKVNANIAGVQFVEDGERFGDAPIDPNEVVTNLEDDDDPSQ